jgi:hypothetical protein
MVTKLDLKILLSMKVYYIQSPILYSSDCLTLALWFTSTQGKVAGFFLRKEGASS